MLSDDPGKLGLEISWILPKNVKVRRTRLRDPAVPGARKQVEMTM